MNMRHDDARRDRRGMLLLVVLSVLTLFLMLGTLSLMLAMRARESARAFSKVMSGNGSRAGVASSMLDEALLLLIRGGSNSVITGTESLLGDMYGSKTVPFTDEAYDACDASNRFLTDTGSSGNTVTRPAFGDAPPTVDNDGDGNADGIWLSGSLQSMAAADGGQLAFRVSFLVLDLDGRINLNAHGSPPGTDVPLGPASIDASGTFSSRVWNQLMSGANPLQRTAVTSTTTQWRPAPLIGAGVAVQGRFGGVVASTYAVRLDREAPRPAVVSGATTANPFTPGELERVLRPFDADAATLPPRLAALLDDKAEAVRMLVTTDSWDVTSKTGPAAGAARELRFDLTSAPNDKAVFAQSLFDAIKSVPGSDPQTIAQWVANVAEFRDPNSPATELQIGGRKVTGAKPSDLRGTAGDWPGGFVSSGDLVAIPKGNKTEIAQILDADPPQLLASLVADCPGILEAVAVPSRFTNTLGADIRREPGRVNVNTCSQSVWELVCGDGAVTRPSSAMKSLWDVLSNTAFTRAEPFKKPDIRKLDRNLANRLASIATVRSNVFAVWITLEITDSSPTAAVPSRHRLFAIVDRSIPVNYLGEGQNSDVRETIRLKRFIK